MFPVGFRFDTKLHARYNEELEDLNNVIQIKVRRLLDRNPSLDEDELVQIGRCVLMVCLSSYDQSRGKPLKVFFGFVLDNHYRDHIASLYSPTRCPRTWVREEDGGGWVERPVPVASAEAITLDSVESPDDVEGDMGDKLTNARRQAIVDRLRKRITPRQLRVLNALIEPGPEVFATALYRQGSYHYNKTHIAEALGMTPSQLEYVAGQLKNEVEKVLDERADIGSWGTPMFDGGA